MKKLLTTLIICLSCAVILSAQNSTLTHVFVDLNLTGQIHWSPDSTSVVMQDTFDDTWYQLDVNTLSVNPSADFPIYIELSPEEMVFFDPKGSVLGFPGDDLTLFSGLRPPSERSRNAQFEVIIANRSTREIFRTGILTDQINRGYIEGGLVQWSEDGYSIAVGLLTIANRIAYFNIPDIENLNLTQVIRFSSSINNEQLRFQNQIIGGVRDISNDGSRILMIAGLSSGNTLQIIEWHPIQDMSRIIRPADDETGSVTSLVYSPLDNNHIIYWKLQSFTRRASGSLYLYNIDTQQETLLWSPEEPVFTPNFSPDGRWLIAENERNEIYLLDIMPILESIPVARAGNDYFINEAAATAMVTLNGTVSTDDGNIVSYVWTENGTQIATGAQPQVTFLPGTHEVILTVTDNEGYSASDLVIVVFNQLPTTYMTPQVSLSVGVHTITLTVTDDDGATASDEMVIKVNRRS